MGQSQPFPRKSIEANGVCNQALLVIRQSHLDGSISASKFVKSGAVAQEF
jgi:hypothetical protein